MHKTLQINCFQIFNARTTLVLILLTIPDCSELHILSHPRAAALSPLCQWSTGCPFPLCKLCQPLHSGDALLWVCHKLPSQQLTGVKERWFC